MSELDNPRLAPADAPAVPVMHERLSRTFSEIGADYEIVFVNDGSSDNAREVLTELARRDPKVVVVNHTRAFGSQSAFTSGMRIATGDAVVLLDGDIVYGVRVERETTAFMRRAYKLFYRVFRRLSYINIPLDAGDFGLLDRRVVDVLNRLSPATMRAVFAKAGFVDPTVRGVWNTYSVAYLAQLVPLPVGLKSRLLPALRAGRVWVMAPLGNLCLIARRLGSETA